MLVVDEILEDYPETDRSRIWITIEEAKTLSNTRPEMSFMLSKALEHLDFI